MSSVVLIAARNGYSGRDIGVILEQQMSPTARPARRLTPGLTRRSIERKTRLAERMHTPVNPAHDLPPDRIALQPAHATAEDLADFEWELGYRACPNDASRSAPTEQRETYTLLRCVGVAAFAATNIMLLSVAVWSGNAADITPEQRDFFHWLSALIALPAAAYAGRPFFTSAVRALAAGRTNMDVPISVGVVLALGMSVFETLHHATHAYFDSALMLLTFLLVGRTLEETMARRARAFAGNLAARLAETVTKFVSDTELAEVPECC